MPITSAAQIHIFNDTIDYYRSVGLYTSAQDVVRWYNNFPGEDSPRVVPITVSPTRTSGSDSALDVIVKGMVKGITDFYTSAMDISAYGLSVENGVSAIGQKLGIFYDISNLKINPNGQIDTIQDIGVSASPTFQTINLPNLTNGQIIILSGGRLITSAINYSSIPGVSNHTELLNLDSDDHTQYIISNPQTDSRNTISADSDRKIFVLIKSADQTKNPFEILDASLNPFFSVSANGTVEILGHLLVSGTSSQIVVKGNGGASSIASMFYQLGPNSQPGWEVGTDYTTSGFFISYNSNLITPNNKFFSIDTSGHSQIGNAALITGAFLNLNYSSSVASLSAGWIVLDKGGVVLRGNNSTGTKYGYIQGTGNNEWSLGFKSNLDNSSEVNIIKWNDSNNIIFPSLSGSGDRYVTVASDGTLRTTSASIGSVSASASGTINTLAKFVTSASLGNSIVSEGGSQLFINGSLKIGTMTGLLSAAAGVIVLAPILPISVGGTNNGSFTGGKFIWFNGDSLVSSPFTSASFITSANGTINRISKFITANSIGDSSISDSGTNVTTTSSLNVSGTASLSEVLIIANVQLIGNAKNLFFSHSSNHIISAASNFRIIGESSLSLETNSGEIYFKPNLTNVMTINSVSISALGNFILTSSLARFNYLSGTGDRLVYADAFGTLRNSTLPTSGIALVSPLGTTDYHVKFHSDGRTLKNSNVRDVGTIGIVTLGSISATNGININSLSGTVVRQLGVDATGNLIVVGAVSANINGTIGKIPKFISPISIGDSLISESGSNITISGNEFITSSLNVSGSASIKTLANSLNNFVYSDSNGKLNYASSISLFGSTHIQITNTLNVSGTTTFASAPIFPFATNKILYTNSSGVISTISTLAMDGTTITIGSGNTITASTGVAIFGNTLTVNGKITGNSDALFNLNDNDTGVFLVRQSTNEYIRINTSDASESLRFGNTTVNNTTQFLGTGSVTIGGPTTHNGQIYARSGSPNGAITGGATDRGQIVVGPNASQQIQIDVDEIQSMNNTTPSVLYINANGGDVRMNGNLGGLILGQDAAAIGLLDVRSRQAGNVIASFGTGTGVNSLYPGYIYFSNVNCINSGYNVPAAAGFNINYAGFQNGTTQYRDLNVMDGKSAIIAHFDGATHRTILNNGATDDGVGILQVGGKIKGGNFYNNSLYSTAIYNAEASGTEYFNAKNGSDNVAAFAPTYNYFSKTLGLGDAFVGSEVLHLFKPNASNYIRIERTSTSYEAGLSFVTAGTGNAYIYMDNTSPSHLNFQMAGEADATPRMRFRGDNSRVEIGLNGGDTHLGASGGNVRIGSSVLDAGAKLDITSDSTSQTDLFIRNYNDSAGSGGGVLHFRRYRGTVAAPAVTVAGDIIGTVRFGSGGAGGSHSTGSTTEITCYVLDPLIPRSRLLTQSDRIEFNSIYSGISLIGSLEMSNSIANTSRSLTNFEVFVYVTATCTLTLPLISVAGKRVYVIAKHFSGGSVGIACSGPDSLLFQGTSLGSTSLSTNGSCVFLVSDGTSKWVIFNYNV
jgi:hypothetical protein